MTSTTPKYEYGFDPEDDNNTAAAVYRYALEGGPRVLDLGSGPGIVAGALATSGDKHVTCLDLDEDSLRSALDRGVQRTFVADLSTSEWYKPVEGENFDVIILADVLEHLVEPRLVIETIRDRGLLEEDGYLVISVPNVAHEAVVASLLSERFTYTPTGLLDATHVRFFTHDTLVRLLERGGFLVTRLHRTLRTLEQTEMFALAPEISSELRHALAARSLDAKTYQFVARATPDAAAGQLVELRDRLDSEREHRVRLTEDLRAEVRAREESEARLLAENQDRVTELQGELTRTEERIAELERELAAQEEREAEAKARRDEVIRKLGSDIDELRTQKEREVADAERALAEVRQRLRDAESELSRRADVDERSYRDLQRRYEEQFAARQALSRRSDRLEAKLDEVYESETWRVGRALLWLPRLLTRGKRGRGTRSRSTTTKGRTSQESGKRPAPAPAHLRLDLEPTESRERRIDYEEALGRGQFENSEAVHVVIGVSTTDLDEGRGDPYTAVGLGLALEAHGYEIMYLTEDRWYDLPEGTDIFLSLLAEPTVMLDPLQVPASVTLIAWIRNNTRRWVESGTLGLYDAVACSSQRTLAEVEKVFDGPTAVIHIGVDAQLFMPQEGSRHGVLASINQWGGTRPTYALLASRDVTFSLAIYGTQRGLDPTLQSFAHGPVSFFSLPSLYGQVAIVLDDQQGVNAPYGNVNSRIYEALAAGALPITSAPAGLELQGLGEVPSYRGRDELDRLISRYLTDESARKALVERLQEQVLEHHTYDRRATDFDRVLRAANSRRAVCVGFSPDYRHTNPFQRMLYAGLEAQGVLLPVDDPRELLTAPRLVGRPRVFNLQWTATILGPARSEDEAWGRAEQFLEAVDEVRRDGVRFVWTVHNVMPHECRYPGVERWLRQGLADRADVVHVLCEATVDEVAGDYGLPPERVHVIPHASYIDVYPNVVDREDARRRLGLEPEDITYLCLGQIRPYKGLDDLLDAFESVHRDRPETRLLIAGKPGRFEGVKELLVRCERQPGVRLTAHELPDEELQVYVKAADVVVLPHRRVLNSGLPLLAFSFARPVIAPASGCLPIVVDHRVGLTYGNDQTLEAAMRRVDELLDPSFHRRAFERAIEQHPDVMAQRFADLTRNLAGVASDQRTPSET